MIEHQHIRQHHSFSSWWSRQHSLRSLRSPRGPSKKGQPCSLSQSADWCVGKFSMISAYNTILCRVLKACGKENEIYEAEIRCIHVETIGVKYMLLMVSQDIRLYVPKVMAFIIILFSYLCLLLPLYSILCRDSVSITEGDAEGPGSLVRIFCMVCKTKGFHEPWEQVAV